MPRDRASMSLWMLIVVRVSRCMMMILSDHMGVVSPQEVTTLQLTQGTSCKNMTRKRLNPFGPFSKIRNWGSN